MKPVSGRRMCQILADKGWSLVRISSSHHIYSIPGPPRVVVSVPVHRNQDLKPGTQRNIMRTARLTDADL